MAVTINQQPTSPGMANSDLLFSVTGNSGQPQYQFVCDIYISGSATRVQRIKQQPNPSGNGVFNLGQIIHSYLESDNLWKTAEFAKATGSAKRFRVLFGEEYGTSVSSSVTLYNGISTTAGAPAKSGSAYYYLVNGLVDPYAAINWNFASSSYFQPTVTPTSGVDTIQANLALTTAPTTKSVQTTEYETLTLFNGNFNNSTSSAQDVYALIVDQYNAAGTLISSSTAFNIASNGGGPRTADAETWDNVAANQTSGSQMLYVGVGPQNLSDAGTPISSSCVYYTVKLALQDSAGTVDPSNYYVYRRYTIEGPACGYDGVRFAWKNQFGVWDYYTFTLQSDSVFNMQRQEYDQTFVDYSSTSTSVSYDKSRRGTSQFYNMVNQTRTANSNWLTQAQADWIRELFFSGDVYIQDGTNLFPVVITSANVVEKTNPRTQKVFQYTIEFKPANQLRPRE